MTALFAWPEAARVDRRIPRDALFRAAGGGKAIRALYENQVERIDWAFKLFERSINLPPAGGVAEIQVIVLTLRGGELDDRVLAHIDKALPRQTWFELVRAAPDGSEVQSASAYKRASDAAQAQVVTADHWRGDWQAVDAPRRALPAAVTLEGLYGGLLAALWPYPVRAGETLRAHAERLSSVAAQARSVERLRVLVRREKDFARQIERNRELRAAEAAFKELTEA